MFRIITEKSLIQEQKRVGRSGRTLGFSPIHAHEINLVRDIVAASESSALGKHTVEEATVVFGLLPRRCVIIEGPAHGLSPFWNVFNDVADTLAQAKSLKAEGYSFQVTQSLQDLATGKLQERKEKRQRILERKIKTQLDLRG
ncbi:MAG: hypothetical protein WAV41_01050 [Microgenomates group bacterium]